MSTSGTNPVYSDLMAFTDAVRADTSLFSSSPAHIDLPVIAHSGAYFCHGRIPISAAGNIHCLSIWSCT